jgi:hypothetical protein
MGQYSQWFYHREVDQQLHQRLDLLAQELHALQEQATLLEDAASCTDNPILQAIAMQQSAEALLEDTPSLSSTEELIPVHTSDKDEAAKSVSSALFAWSHLPNLDTQNVSLSTQEPATPEPETGQQASLPHTEINLLPPDMATFIDTHEQTLPQIQVPRWLHNASRATQTTDAHKLAASASEERTDASIRRWLERWGKQLPDSPPTPQHKPQEAQQHE